MSEKDAAEDSNITSNELQEKRQTYETKLRRAEEAYKRDRSTLDQASEVYAQEVEAMDNRLLRLRDVTNEECRLSAAVRRAHEARLCRTARHDEHQRRTKEISSAIMDVVAVCAEHRELVQQRLGDVREMYVQRLERMLTGDAAEAVQTFAAMAIEEYRAKMLDESLSEQAVFASSHFPPDQQNTMQRL